MAVHERYPLMGSRQVRVLRLPCHSRAVRGGRHVWGLAHSSGSRRPAVRMGRVDTKKGRTIPDWTSPAAKGIQRVPDAAPSSPRDGAEKLARRLSKGSGKGITAQA